MVPKQGKIVSLINQPVFIQSEMWVKNHQYQESYRTDIENKKYPSIQSISNMATKYTNYFALIIHLKFDIFLSSFLSYCPLFLAMLMTGIEVLHPEAQWLLFVPPALNSETYSLATQITCVFCAIPPVNANDFCTQH